jgi:hypothetical protein
MALSGESASADCQPKGSHSHAMDVLVFILAAFIVLPLTLGFALPRRAAWPAWAAVAAFMIVAQEAAAITALGLRSKAHRGYDEAFMARWASEPL